MSNCSLLHIYGILVVILVVSLTEHKSYGDYVTALNTVPAAGKYFLFILYSFLETYEEMLRRNQGTVE